MSTESLFHHFVIDTQEGAERIAEALAITETHPPFGSSSRGTRREDPEEIRQTCDKMLAAAGLDTKTKAVI